MDTSSKSRMLSYSVDTQCSSSTGGDAHIHKCLHHVHTTHADVELCSNMGTHTNDVHTYTCTQWYLHVHPYTSDINNNNLDTNTHMHVHVQPQQDTKNYQERATILLEEQRINEDLLIAVLQTKVFTGLATSPVL